MKTNVNSYYKLTYIPYHCYITLPYMSLYQWGHDKDLLFYL